MAIGAAILFGLRVQQTAEMRAKASKKTKKDGAARVVPVSIAEAPTGQVRQEFLLTGALRPKEQVDVTAKATGRVEKLAHQFGDFVKKGALIAEFEDDEMQQQVSRSKAALAVVNAATKQRMAELDNSKANQARYERLTKEGLTPRTGRTGTGRDSGAGGRQR